MHSTSRVCRHPQAAGNADCWRGGCHPSFGVIGLVRSRSVAARRERMGLEDVLKDRATLEAEEKNKSDKHTVRSRV